MRANDTAPDDDGYNRCHGQSQQQDSCLPSQISNPETPHTLAFQKGRSKFNSTTEKVLSIPIRLDTFSQWPRPSQRVSCCKKSSQSNCCWALVSLSSNFRQLKTKLTPRIENLLVRTTPQWTTQSCPCALFPGLKGPSPCSKALAVLSMTREQNQKLGSKNSATVQRYPNILLCEKLRWCLSGS